jgi:hypothetical protein
MMRDWLIGQQERIEKALARRHLNNGTLVLYDVTSTYFEGGSCPLAKFGYNRDGKSGKLQIVFGLLCTTEGCPVAVEVFDGMSAIRRRWRTRSPSSRSASGSNAWCSSAIAA